MSRPIHRRCLPARQNDEAERLENRVKITFVNASSPLGCRPEPRSRIDKVVSENRRPWGAYADTLRDIAREARTRSPEVRKQVDYTIMQALLALTDYVFEPLEGTTEERSFLCVAKELPEAAAATMVAEMVPTPENIATADVESGEAVCALTLHRGALRRKAQSVRSGSYMRPMGATPLGGSPQGVA
jgi:hypothetical protein